LVTKTGVDWNHCLEQTGISEVSCKSTTLDWVTALKRHFQPNIPARKHYDSEWTSRLVVVNRTYLLTPPGFGDHYGILAISTKFNPGLREDALNI